MNQVVVKQEKSGYQIVEAYKSLRTNLQFCGEDKSDRSYKLYTK